jgi:hypothetical protein
MRHHLMGIYQVCSNKSPWFKIGLGPGAYIQVSNFRAIMALLFVLYINFLWILIYNIDSKYLIYNFYITSETQQNFSL